MWIAICLGLACLCLTLAIVILVHEQGERSKEWALERGALLQRIQAPEVAVYENAIEDRKAPPKLGFEDDKAFLALRKMRDSGGS